MITVYHFNDKITAVICNGQKINFEHEKTIAGSIQKLAAQFPNKEIAWCRSDLKEMFNIENSDKLFHHDRMMLSYAPDEGSFLGNTIGYADESVFINVNKKVTFPTWRMSSAVGIINAGALLKFSGRIHCDADFEYYLNSIAKVGMPQGLLCYSEPQLLINPASETASDTSLFKVFRFVKQHYRSRWLLLLFLNLMVYEKRFAVFPFIAALFFTKRNTIKIGLENWPSQSDLHFVNKGSLDVIIPTIGREQYLYDFLSDLKAQTHLPENVIIVEQNPDVGSGSALPYLQNESWPFQIKHVFIHQPGACNARNSAMENSTGEWVFFADDDIRIPADFIEKIFENLKQTGAKAITVACLNLNQDPTFNTVFQWPGFGSGCSFVLSEAIGNNRFDTAYEFGYGEDSDFGMQLRKDGFDILYIPSPKILHLQAPIGGFRSKPVLAWHHEKIQPKPSPTVMLFIISHNTKQQLSGYKTTLFIKYYKHQSVKNPVRYFRTFKKQWNQSVYWANELKKQQ